MTPALRASTGKPSQAASSRCTRAGVCDLRIDPCRAPGARRIRVRARGRVRRRRSLAGAAAGTTCSAHGSAGRALRREIRPAAVARANAIRSRLSQARTVPGHAPRCRRRRQWSRSAKACRTGCRRFREAAVEAEIEAALGTTGGGGLRDLRRPAVAANLIAQVHRRESSRTARARKTGRGQGCAAYVAARFRSRSR